jgi:hypothetical protein
MIYYQRNVFRAVDRALTVLWKGRCICDVIGNPTVYLKFDVLNLNTKNDRAGTRCLSRISKVNDPRSQDRIQALHSPNKSKVFPHMP